MLVDLLVAPTDDFDSCLVLDNSNKEACVCFKDLMEGLGFKVKALGGDYVLYSSEKNNVKVDVMELLRLSLKVGVTVTFTKEANGQVLVLLGRDYT
jgi:hypothetical protein